MGSGFIAKPPGFNTIRLPPSLRQKVGMNKRIERHNIVSYPCIADGKSVYEVKESGRRPDWWGVYEKVKADSGGEELRWLFDCVDRRSAMRAIDLLETPENEVKIAQFAFEVLDAIDGKHAADAPEVIGVAKKFSLVKLVGDPEDPEVMVTFGKYGKTERR